MHNSITLVKSDDIKYTAVLKVETRFNKGDDEIIGSNIFNLTTDSLVNLTLLTLRLLSPRIRDTNTEVKLREAERALTSLKEVVERGY